ncbi:hypothetical protein [Streptomyces sp. NPDC002889]|uniref:hypothetical protein n=1 Tax=Streptomyces sp. NPDC002889 TaxID=3364669 RepID=UPI003680D2AC
MRRTALLWIKTAAARPGLLARGEFPSRGRNGTTNGTAGSGTTNVRDQGAFGPRTAW